ncbi:MAG: hypothetical protein MPJ78_04470 [Hyphomicrobiaceae bacterium]|nr:hypothetical protein [Hyphomicrobiaceae bacterium]
MKTLLLGAAAVGLLFFGQSAHAYPQSCVAAGYTPAQCACSFGRWQQGSLTDDERHNTMSINGPCSKKKVSGKKKKTTGSKKR